MDKCEKCQALTSQVKTLTEEKENWIFQCGIHEGQVISLQSKLKTARESLEKIRDENECVRSIGCPNCSAREALKEIGGVE